MADTIETPASQPTPAPAPAPAAPVVAPQTTVHNTEDKVYNKIAAAMAKAQAAAPAPAVALPSQIPPAPNGGAQPPIAADPAAAASTPDVAAPISLEDLDFDTPVEEETPPVTPPSPVAAAAETQTEAQAVAALQEMLDKGEVPDKVESAFLRTSRGKQMLESYKTLRELRKSPDEGGIGRIPTLDEIREGYSSAQQLQAMRFEASDNPDSFVANLFTINPQTGASFIGDPAKTRTVVEKIYGHLATGLARTNSPVYGEMLAAYSFPVFNGFLNHQYQLAQAMPQSTEQERSDKARVLDALQILEHKTMGQVRPLNLQTGAPAAAPNGYNDPEKEQLRARLAQYEQDINRNRQQNMEQATRAVTESAKSAALKDIDTLFSRVGVSKVYDSVVLSPHRSDLFNMVSEVLPRHDPLGWQTYEVQMQQAARGQIDSAKPAETYRRLFQNALRSSPAVRERIDGLVRHAKIASDSQHASLQSSQNRVGTNGAGAPPPTSVLPAQQMARQPGETREEHMARRLATPLLAALPRQ